MRFQRYDDIGAFEHDTFTTLQINEVQNNLLIGLISSKKVRNTTDWLLATIVDSGGICLTAIYIEPFDLLLYETGNIRHDGGVELLSNELRRIGCYPPGIMAESGLAARFADAFYGAGKSKPYMTIAVMRLDDLSEYVKAPGTYRMLEPRDMFYAPYWERAFSEDCRTRVFSIQENTKRIRTRLGKDTHLIWEDGVPVSQAVHGRDTPNGAVINGVYTPPHFRRCGYATSVVAELSSRLLGRGRSFCCLFADAGNPASRKLYRNLGYYDVSELSVLKYK